tara:strand:- start:328 stop:720 length:393 start_codon:yes stop_codon:yes gene_type:complete
MGRYYQGDIEGKFWFGVQSSADADFFGDEGQASHLHYYFDKDDHSEGIKNGIKNCRDILGVYENIFDEFFNSREYYNKEELIEYLDEKIINITGGHDIDNLLEWYARLRLGMQILECVEDQGSCCFQAEL